MPDQPRGRTAGPARALTPQAETYAGIALGTAAAHAANWIKEVPSPQGTAMLWACFVTLVFGFGWAGYCLIRPNLSKTR